MVAMSMKFTHEIAEDLFGDAYTVERREFSDGDKRTVIIHTVGWSATNYVQAKVWVETADVWIEYYEDAVLRFRRILDYHDEFDGDVDLMGYVW